MNIDGFCLYRKDRNRQAGGVACYVRAEFPCTRLQSFDTPGLETLWLLLRPLRMPRWLSHIVIAVIYHPPNANSHEMTEHITSCADEITRAHPNAGILIVGDFNRLRDGPLRSYPLRQVVRGRTRKDSVLDKIYRPTTSLIGIIHHLSSHRLVCPITIHNAVVMHPIQVVACAVTSNTKSNGSVVKIQATRRLLTLCTGLTGHNCTNSHHVKKWSAWSVLSLMDQYLPLRPL